MLSPFPYLQGDTGLVCELKRPMEKNATPAVPNPVYLGDDAQRHPFVVHVQHCWEPVDADLVHGERGARGNLVAVPRVP